MAAETPPIAEPKETIKLRPTVFRSCARSEISSRYGASPPVLAAALTQSGGLRLNDEPSKRKAAGASQPTNETSQ